MTLSEDIDKVNESLKKDGIAHLGERLFQLTSKSDETKSYILDLNDINAHKSDCYAFRYGKECNHIKRLKKAGFIKDD